MSFSPVLDAQAAALKLREERAALLSSNLVNASTPHYKARDFDFSQALKEVTDSATNPRLGMARTDPGHMAMLSSSGSNRELEYSEPLQGAFDKNTVDPDLEQAKFAENAVQYQATLSFMKGHIKGLLLATQGE